MKVHEMARVRASAWAEAERYVSGAMIAVVCLLHRPGTAARTANIAGTDKADAYVPTISPSDVATRA